MANFHRRVAENVPGAFFVDATCIDCDTCRQLAPAVFAEGPGHAYVHRQPEADPDRRQALRALVCCPTGSIGVRGGERPQGVMDDFPLPVEDPVYYCGFTSPHSYGGSSYFVRHPDGNWLIDAPKFQPRLVRRLEDLGGLAHLFLTHRDDVADAHRYAEHFGARRVIHRRELAAQPDAETVLDGTAPVALAPEFLAIPTPGHTAGHCALLFRDRFLFTGDHLDWDRHERRLDAAEDYCWYSWPEQVASVARLTAFRFAWVLPGHGQRVHLPEEEMRRQLEALVERLGGRPRRAGTG
jgi:glyoxylase-like metal-dependent hydrolase (beta-lactamase superfamily II)/ferredoxin